jgi:aminopeptidase N
MNSEAADGHVRLTFASRVPMLDSIVLMMDTLVCDSVKRNGAPLAFQRPTGLLVVTLDAPLPEGESTAVDIWYHRRNATPNLPNRGFYWYPPSTRHVLAFSCAAPYDARFWFPCFDEPFDKAEQGCAINVTVPDTLAVCANGLLDSVRTDSAAHTRTWFWTHRFPIATYLMVFAASKWVRYVQEYHPHQPDSLVVWSYCPPEDSQWVQSNLVNLPDMIGFYSDTLRFGRYPFERYGHVYCTGFPWGGMENQTLTMLAMGVVNDNTISHELSHMWWGDMVTCIDYRNIWLNEGFATYWEAQYTEHRLGHAQFLNKMNGNASSYFSEDAGRRFATYAPRIEDVYAYGTIYCKGAWLQHMLRYVVNDTVFRAPGGFYRALRAWGDSFRYGGASSEDWQRFQERESGLDLDWFFDEWLYQAGYPQYRLAWSAESVGPDVRVITNLSQNNGSNAPPVFHMPVQLKFRKPGRDSLVVLDVNAGPQIDTFLLPFRPDSISFDPGKWILKKITAVNGVDEQFISQPDPGLEILGSALVRDAAQFAVRSPQPAVLSFHDAAGRETSRYRLNPGTVHLTWDCSRLPAGVYLARLASGGRSENRKLVVTR